MKESYLSLEELASDLRNDQKKNIIIFAHNGTGKTRLSAIFKDIAKRKDASDTLYFNAFTEDLFFWDNDFDYDIERILCFHSESHFFDGLRYQEMETRIRPILSRFTDFDFSIEQKTKIINGLEQTIDFIKFKRMEFNEKTGNTEWVENIKISRGEENIFKWCFFLAIAGLAIDRDISYNWVNYIYIDDPISSLDDNNSIAVANHLASLLKRTDNNIHTVISTHHGLFYNVIFNELKSAEKLYLFKESDEKDEVTLPYKTIWKLKNIKDTPFFHHISIIKELNKAVKSNQLYTYHFNMLRNLLEKTAAFHGFNKFGDCIKKFENDSDELLYSRMINILSHGNYSLFEPVEMQMENKEYFKKIYQDFLTRFPFNEDI